MQVHDVMTPNAECIRPDDTVQKAARRMRDLDIGAMPVCGPDDKLAGMITDRDIAVRVVAEGMDPKSTMVRDAMTAQIITCFEDQDALEAANLMRENQVRRLMVLNRNKRLVGIVSLGDLAVEGEHAHEAGEALRGISEPAAPRR